MPRRTTNPFLTSRFDLITTLVVGGLAAVWVTVFLVARLITVASNDSVPVLVSLTGVDQLPLGPGGSMVPADVSTATVLATGMPPVTQFCVAAAAAVPAIAALAVIACSLLLFTRLLRGRFFSRGNTALVGGISIIIAVAWAAGGLLATMASNGALALVSNRELESVQFQLDFVPILISMGIGALCAAFHAGDRMQRDTEGLG